MTRNACDRMGSRVIDMTRCRVAIAVALVAFAPAASAATLTWGTSGAGGSGTWSDTGIWNGSTWSNAAPDSAVFAGTGGSVSLATTQTTGSITFNSFTGAYTIGTLGGQTLQINGGGITLNSGAGAATINSPVTLGAAQSWTNNSSSLLTVAGNVTNGGFLLTAAGSGNTTISGTIAGSGGLTKTGAGTLTLSASNTYTGFTTVSGGTLSATGGGNVYATLNNSLANAVTINSGGTLNFDNWAWAGSFGTLYYDNTAIVINGGTLRYSGTVNGYGSRLFTIGANGATLDAAGSALWQTDKSGVYTTVASSNGGTLTLTGTGNGRIDMNIPGTGGVTKSGAGTWTLTGSNTFSGTTRVGAGTLAISGSLAIQNSTLDMNSADSGSLTFSQNSTLGGLTGSRNLDMGTRTLSIGNNNASTTYSGTLSNGALTKVGTGVLTLTGTSTYIGATTISGGTLAVTGGGILYSNRNQNSTITINTGATLTFDSWTYGTGTPFGTLWNSSGNFVVNGGTLRFVGAASNSGGRSLTIGGSGATLDSATAGQTWTISVQDVASMGSNGGLLTLTGSGNGAINQIIPGTGGVTKSGTGTWTLRGVNTYSGATTVSSGSLVAGGTAAFGAASGNIVAQGGVLNLGGYNFTRTGTISFTGGTVQSGTLTNDTVAFDGQSGTVSAVLAGSVGLTKTTSGTLTLSNANTYSGPTQVNAGVLALGVANALSNSTALTVTGGAFDLGGFSDTVASVSITSGSILGSGGTLTATTYGLGGGTVAGNLGAGTLTVTANSALNGTAAASVVNLNSGTLTLGAGGRLTSAAVAVSGSSGAAIVLGGNEAFGSLAGAANVALGSNTLSVGGANANTTYAGVVSGLGGLTKTGTGKLTFTDAQAYTGSTIISGGTLALASGASLAQSIYLKAGAAAGDGGTLDVSALGGGLSMASGQKLGGYGTVLGNVTIGSGAIMAPGGSIGTLTNSGTETWAAGGHYLFEITNATGTAAGTTWDLLNVTALSITATSGIGNQFVIDLQSLTNATDQSAGPMSGGNWDPSANYQWKFLIAGATTFSSANFDSSWFTVTSSSSTFQNTINGSFYVARGGGDGGLGGDTSANALYIVYAAVPEPGSLALAGIGLAAAGVMAMRRRRRVP